MFERDKTDAEEEENHRLGQVSKGVNGDLDDFAACLRDVVFSIRVEYDTVDEDCDNARELEAVGDEVADPRAQKYDADFRVEILLVVMFLNVLAQFFLVGFFLLHFLGKCALPLEDEGGHECENGAKHK